MKAAKFTGLDSEVFSLNIDQEKNKQQFSTPQIRSHKTALLTT